MGKNSEINILVVDDDADCLKLVQTVLKAQGFQVAGAANGEEAIKFLENNKPSLVVLDIMMPVINGYEVAEKMKADQSLNEIPIIMLTAKSESEDIMKGYGDYKVDYYITKPFNGRQLVSGVRLVLGIADDIPSSEA